MNLQKKNQKDPIGIENIIISKANTIIFSTMKQKTFNFGIWWQKSYFRWLYGLIGLDIIKLCTIIWNYIYVVIRWL